VLIAFGKLTGGLTADWIKRQTKVRNRIWDHSMMGLIALKEIEPDTNQLRT
jgi:hypothetical protein